MFDVNKDSRILFYGFSRLDMVRDKYSDMLEHGYHVLGYIDQNAEKLRKTEKISCWNLTNLPFEKNERKDIIVIVLLQNGQVHEKIAQLLAEEGFSDILFLPASLETEEQKQMCMIYNFFLEGGYEQLKNIPEVQSVIRGKLPMRQIIPSGKNARIVFVPTEILFLYQEDSDGLRCNIRYDRLYRELYDFLTGKRKECRNYLQFMEAEDEETQKRLLEDRRELFLKFEYENNLETDFFVRSAANVRWNKNGYFNIIDGHHRAEFLVYKGYRCIPVRILEEDFKLWENRDILNKCKGMEHVNCPVPNPAFLNSFIFYFQIWREVTDYMYNYIFSDRKEPVHMLEIDTHNGYFARVCQLFGWTISHTGVYSAEQMQACQQICRLLRQNDIEMVDYRETLRESAQVVYIDSRIVDIAQFEKLIYHERCKYVIVEVNLSEQKGYMEVLEQKFKKKAQLICWCDSNTGIYGTGE